MQRNYTRNGKEVTGQVRELHVRLLGDQGWRTPGVSVEMSNASKDTVRGGGLFSALTQVLWQAGEQVGEVAE